MNSMNDERFFDLAMKVIARQATDAERTELDARLARDPDLRAEFERLQANARTARDALPLVDATQATAAVVLLVALPIFRTPNAPVIQVAMLDTAGAVRGSDTNEIAVLRETLVPVTLDSFTTAEALREWEAKGSPNAVKVIYDRAATKVRILGKWHGKSFEKSFLVDPDLAAALKAAKSFIAEQTKQ